MGFRTDEEVAQRRIAELERELTDARATAREALDACHRVRRRVWFHNSRAVLLAAAALMATAGFVAGIRGCFGLLAAELPRDVPGVVTDRYHHEAFWTQNCAPVGTTVTCTPVFHPARWTLRVAHDGHERLDEVDETTWHRTAVGDVR